ncbi:ribonuclease T [Shewanella sp. NIFS-20-20]|uniref:ribonuclease T2 family protein n=1 Tax=Shewanella sp. NIFS-20-20 TaxID=2853806 RepID=UPI001C488B87|nr:ribonuclease T [Shewanella sp. NIFS-20-20]MBV7316329.1 ribonuclease T [Shewanella sp. NIFS-20-20]
MSALRFPLIVLWLLTAPMAASAAPLQAQFMATDACPLFQSKNKQTNPGEHYTQVGQEYAVIEFLGNRDNPSWYRLRTAASQSPQRWVKASCGKISGQPTHISPQKNDAHSCSTAEQYDSHRLALSWQNAFCQLKGRKKAECKAMLFDASLPAHREFSLHGLWPNKQGCGINYGYCGSVATKPKSFCDYPALHLSAPTRQQLEALMPSAQFGTCLQRHEYWKHGSCTDDGAEGYFAQAIRLTQAVNDSHLVRQTLSDHLGKTMSRKQFMQAFMEDFGSTAANKVSLQCQGGMLVEILISLPKALDNGSLSSLLSQADPINPGSCPAQFTIDDPGYH